MAINAQTVILVLATSVALGCSSNTIEVTHAEGVGSVTVSVGGEDIDITLDAERRGEVLCHSYDLSYEEHQIVGYAPNSPKECERSEGFTFNWVRLVNPILRIITRFF